MIHLLLMHDKVVKDLQHYTSFHNAYKSSLNRRLRIASNLIV